MSTAHRLGQWGEDAARLFLEHCGYECVDRRYRRPGGEIDLVMRRGGLVVFVEVKTRGRDALAPPEAWFSAGQRRRLRRLALQWLADHAEVVPAGLRFDLVAVHYEGRETGASLRHLAGVG
jgi:putative endonuclease